MDDDIVEFDLDLSAVSSTVSIDDSVISNNDTFTITLDDTYSTDWISTSCKPGIEISDGDVRIHQDGDLKIGDRSLKDFMDKMEERLGIYTLNPELEQEVEELKKLGQQYKDLEEKIKSKKKLLDTIKNSDMPSCQ